MGIENCGVLGIENCRVLGIESGRVGPLSRGGSVATGAGRPPGCSAGVSPAFVSAQLALLLQRDSTGNHARALLWPGSRRFCRRGWRVHHRRETERNAAAVHAGETPALPGGVSLPQCSRHSLALPSNATRPAITPGLCFGRVHAISAGGVGGCTIAGVLRGTQRECMRARRPRSRVGRLFRSVLGTAWPFPPTRLDRQSRQGSALAGFTPFLPAGLAGAPSQAFCAVRCGSACGRDARAPGWGASSHRSCSSTGRAPAGPQTCRCGRIVPPGVPSCP